MSKDQDEEILALLRADTALPEVAGSEIFWAGFARDLDGAIVKAQRQRRRRVLGAVAVAATLVLGLGLGLRPRSGGGQAPQRAARVDTPAASTLVPDGDDEEDSSGLLVQELSDEELARVIRDFPRGG